MTARHHANTVPLSFFLGMLVVVTASNLLAITIPNEFARYGVDGTPSNTIASSIMTSAAIISRIGTLVTISLVPVVLAEFLSGSGIKHVGRAVSAVLLLSLCASVVLTLNPSLFGNLFSARTSFSASVFLTIISAGMGLFTVIVPMGAAIWLSRTIGPSVLAKVVIILSGAIVVLSALLAWDISVPYSDHYAFILYTFVFAFTFRHASGGLRIWGGLLVANWLLPFLFAWVPELVQASLISYAPDRLDAYLAVLAQIPPPPQYGIPITPLLLGAMLAFSDAGARCVARWLATLLGAIIMAYASILAFEIFVYSPAQAIEALRFGALTSSGAIVSGVIWLVLFTAPFAMVVLSARLYTIVAPGLHSASTNGGL